MVKNTSQMFITGPQVIKAVTAEEVTLEQLGGAETHNTVSGVAHFAAENDIDCLEKVRQLLSFLPSNNLEEAPAIISEDDINRTDPALNNLLPDDPNQPYDMREVIRSVVDGGNFFEVHAHYAHSIFRWLRLLMCPAFYREPARSTAAL